MREHSCLGLKQREDTRKVKEVMTPSTSCGPATVLDIFIHSFIHSLIVMYSTFIECLVLGIQQLTRQPLFSRNLQSF